MSAPSSKRMWTGTLVGDYYLPFYDIPEVEPYHMKRWALQHMDYLKNDHPIRYNQLALSDHWDEYFRTVDEQAEEKFELLITQMKEYEGVTEELKHQNQMLWVWKMNNIHHRAEEIVLNELIFV